MKREALFDAITDIRDDLIERAQKPFKKKRPIRWIAPVAAAATIALTVTAIVQPGRDLFPETAVTDSPIADAPDSDTPVTNPPYINTPEADEPDDGPAADVPNTGPEADIPDTGPLIVAHAVAEAKYSDSQISDQDLKRAQQSLNLLAKKTVPEILDDSKGENRAYSPVSLFMALATLAEITGEDAQKEILKIFGVQSQNTLKVRAQQLWNTTYSILRHGGFRMANSLWLDSDVPYKAEPLEQLATDYYASSFHGTMGSEDYEKLLQDWLKKETGGLIETDEQENFFTPNSFLAFVNTFYLHTEWGVPFEKEDNFTGTFYTADGEQTVEYMTNEYLYDVYNGEHFSALTKEASYGEMVVFLPEKGMRPEELLKDQEFIKHLTDYSYNGGIANTLNRKLVLPKFNVSSDLSLKQPLKELGIRTVFEENTENFAPILEEKIESKIETFKQEISLKVDEQGCIAAGYTFYDGRWKSSGAGDGEDFIVDRPFLFVIRSQGIPLFIGIVNQVE